MEGKQFLFTLHYPDEKTVQRIESLAKAKHYRVSRDGSEKQIKIEGKIPNFPVLGVKLENKNKIPEYLAIYLELKKYVKIIYS
jgi:hypothetical protein